MAKAEDKEGRALTRRPLLSPIEEIFEPMRLIDDVFRPSRFLGSIFPRSWPMSWADNALMSSTDVEESGDQYLVRVDLPGFKKEDIHVECTDNELTISAERSDVETSRGSSRRRYGSFRRSFTLPQGVSLEQIKAGYENGVLTVHVPRGEESRPRRIEISEGASEAVPVPTKTAAKESDARTTH